MLILCADGSRVEHKLEEEVVQARSAAAFTAALCRSAAEPTT